MCTVRSWWVLPLCCQCATDIPHQHMDTKRDISNSYASLFFSAFFLYGPQFRIAWNYLRCARFGLNANGKKEDDYARLLIDVILNDDYYELSIQCTKTAKKRDIIFALWHGIECFLRSFFRRFVKPLHTLIKYIFFNSWFNWHLGCDGRSEIYFSF